MARPRKEQLFSRNTRRSLFPLSVSAGATFSIVAAGTLNPFILTDTQGGAEEDVPAIAVGTTVEPYTIVAADAIIISVDGAAGITVTFGGPDTITSKVVARINGTAGIPANFASNSNGNLILRGPTTGIASTITLSDFVPGTLAKLGLVAGTITGANAATRGVLTKTPDIFGGIVPINLAEGQTLLTSLDEFLPVLRNSSISSYIPNIRGGYPVVGRIAAFGVAYRLNYFAKLPTRGQVITGDSSFALLDATDSFTIMVNTAISTLLFTVTFPAPPYLTAAAVADRINDLYRIVANTTAGNPAAASISGKESQPFDITASDGFSISFDGAASIGITFLGTENTAALVAARVNALIGASGTATVVNDGDSNLSVTITSNNTNGRTSSVEIIGETSTTRKLGLPTGKFHGFFCADVYGTGSVRILSPSRGPGSSVTIGGINPTTLTRMGLTAGVYAGSSTQAYESVALPEPTSFGVVFPASPYTIECLIPEVLEFGEIRADYDTILTSFEDSEDGDSTVYGHNFRFDPAESEPTNVVNSFRSGKDSGKHALVTDSGTIDTNFLRPSFTYANKFFKKFLRTASGSFEKGDVSHLVANIIETPGTNGNPLAKSSTFVIDVDPDNTFPAANGLFFRQGRDVNPLNIPFFVQRGGGGPSGANWRASGGYVGNPFAWGSDSNLFNFYDVNTIAAGGAGVIPLTNAFARTVRVWEKESVGTSLLFNLQARDTVTCGDGVSSFGDFNGADALYQAMAYFTSSTTFSQGKIKLKAGTFTLDAINGTLTVPLNRSITIEGWGAIASIISVGVGLATATANVGFSVLQFKDVSITKAAAPFSIMQSSFGAGIKFEDCIVQNVAVQVVDGFYTVESSIFLCNSLTADKPILEIIGSAGGILGPFKATNSTFRSGQNNSVLRVSSANAAVPLTKIRGVLFEDCEMHLMSTTGAATMVGNPGVLSVLPNGSNSYLGTGCIITDILYKNCAVRANSAAGAISILVYYVPQGNGLSYASGERLDIARFEIDGGSWLAPSSSTTFNPFTLLQPALATTTDGLLGSPLGRASEDGGIFLRNVLFGFDNFTSITGVNQGKATTDCNDILWDGPGDAAPALASEWAAWVLNSRYIDIQDIKFVGMSQLGNSGDLFIKYDKLVIDGISFNEYKQGGPGVAPLFRIKFRSAITDPSDYNSSQHAIVKNVILNGKDATTGWCTAAFGSFVHIDPNSAGVVGGLPVISARGRVVIDGLIIEGFLLGPFGGPYFPALSPAITLNGGATTGSLYTGSVAGYRNITVRNCEISNCGSALVYVSLSDAQFRYISSLVFENNRVIGCAGGGIVVSSGAEATAGNGYVGWDNVTVSNNYIASCSSFGINISQDFWRYDFLTLSSTVTVVNNTVINNNGSATANQMYIGCRGLAGNVFATNASAKRNGPNGILMGNNCALGDALTPGGIQLNRWRADGTAVNGLPVTSEIGSGGSDLVLLRGSYTDIDDTTVSPNIYRWDDLKYMVFNTALLNSAFP
jgi:hypothetical protein